VDLGTFDKIRDELSDALKGTRFTRVFQLTRSEYVFDFRMSESLFLFVSIDPSQPRVYLIHRRLRDIERSSITASPFALTLKKELSGAEFESIRLIEGERILIIRFTAISDAGTRMSYQLLIQLTGKSANLFLLDSNEVILTRARKTEGEGQQAGDRYWPPAPHGARQISNDRVRSAIDAPHGSLSENLDAFYLQKEEDKRFLSIAGQARSAVRRERSKLERLRERLQSDRTDHGDADRWKRSGDLLLANAATAKREVAGFRVIDYFDEQASEITIEADENDSVTEAAEKYFRRFTKARKAAKEIAKRLAAIDSELAELEKKEQLVESAIEGKDESKLQLLAGRRQSAPAKGRSNNSEMSSVARSFYSSDGFEILVGKRAKDNDLLTFKIAKSLDTWMHAADYPGSHVVVRNPNRKEIPGRTLLEAAQLAAFYSQGKAQPKAAVHYTLKKFVNKPKGAAPGLVSLASFKTLLVEPSVPALRREPAAS
jgi:predicted ribosome quality control (RQC) complex YloA/Tae2 family protein